LRSIQLVSLALLSVLPVMARQSPPESVQVEGRVLNALSATPIRRAKVSYEPFTPAEHAKVPTGAERAEQPDIFTDSEGRFALPLLAPGDYTVKAVHVGFYPERQRPTRIHVEGGLTGSNIELRLVPYSVITGRVLDEEGEPVRSAAVTARQYVYGQDGRTLADGPSARTDDLGEYRLFDIVPGRYVVQAQPPEHTDFNPLHPGAATSLLTAYYPGSADANAASVVELNAGRQLQGIDITLRRGYIPTIRGRVVAPAGAAKLKVALHYEDGMGPTSAAFDPQDKNGNFTLRGIRPGVYVISAQCAIGEHTLFAKMPLQVGSSDVEGVELRPAPIVALKGHMQIEGAPASRVKGLGVWLIFGGGGGAAGQSVCSYIHEGERSVLLRQSRARQLSRLLRARRRSLSQIGTFRRFGHHG
jgi:protocatechuate 3,4-dioxygenase beta subunit